MQNWVNSFPELILLILMLTQFLFLWGILMSKTVKENSQQQAH